MAKTQWILLLSTCVVSAVCVILYLVAFLTTNWASTLGCELWGICNLADSVCAEASNAGALQNSRIEYGVFGGTLTRHLLASGSRYRLQVVCSYADGACIYSCQLIQEQRELELRQLLSRQQPAECPAVGSLPIAVRGGDSAVAGGSIEVRAGDVLEAAIAPGYWVTVVTLLSLGTVFALIATAFAALNIFYNPVEPIWGVLGLYIWNGIAASCATLTLIVWGALFSTQLTSNIAVSDTLVPSGAYDSAGLATLGYSYWLLFAPMLLHVANCGLLWWRKRIIEAEPKQPTFIVEAKQDFTHMWF